MTRIILGPATIVSAPFQNASVSVQLAQTGDYSFTGYYGSSGSNQFPINFDVTTPGTETFNVSVKDDYYNTGSFALGQVFEILLTTNNATVAAKNGWTSAGTYYYTYSFGTTFYPYPAALTTSLAAGSYTLTLIPRGIGQGEVNAHYQFDVQTLFNSPPPLVLDLAGLSQAVYNSVGSYDGFNLVGRAATGNNFFAETYQRGSQIVVAFRGTELTSGKNWSANESFATLLPTFILASDVARAAQFVADTAAQYAGSIITLTGHSLGGAIAQLVGKAAGLTTTTFNAPGAASLYTSLAPQLAPAAALNTKGIFPTIRNYRVEGDQVSTLGVQLGPTETIVGAPATNWPNALYDHSIDTVVSYLTAGKPVVADFPDPVLPGFVFGTVVATVGGILSTFHADIPAIARHLGFDPSPAISYTLIEDASSPAMTSIELPTSPGLAAYSISFETSTGWSAPITVAPLVEIDQPAGFVAATFSGLDADGNAQPINDDTVFDVGFISAGSFDGTLAETIACFVAGTHIAVPEGEAQVERVAVGSFVTTNDGKNRRVKWIGRRSYAGRFLSSNPKVQPIRFRAGSLGNGLPHRDLLVSPEHAMFLDGVLVPARHLVTGTTIVQERGSKQVDYYHVELDSHDVLLAEGAPSESFIDDDSRAMFHNAPEFAALYPDAPAPASFYAVRVESGFELEAIRARLADIGEKVALVA